MRCKMMYIKYRNMVIQFIGNNSLLKELDGKAVLGKGRLEVINNWCGETDYTLEYLETDTNDIKYYDDKIVLEGSYHYVRQTTIVQAVVFMLYQKKNYLTKIISLHASAVVKGDTLILFIGGKGSGKTSMSYLLSKKYEDIKLAANDYIELKFNKDHTYTVVNSDYDSEISFRSHVLYNLDKDLYVRLTGSEQLIFNETVKSTVDFVNLKENTIVCKKLKLIFIGLGKTADLEISQKTGVGLQIELYKELVQYIRGKVVAAIEDGKVIAPFYLDSSYFFDKKISDNVFEVIRQIEECDDIDVKWIRGSRPEIENYLVKSSDCRERERMYE